MQESQFTVAFGADSALTIPPHVLQIQDAPDNVLRVLVALTRRRQPPCTDDLDPKLQQVLSQAVGLCPDEEQIYEITFDGYILYQVGNESYCGWGPDKQSAGRHFLIFDRSRLLERLSDFSDCQQLPDGTFYPRPWKHYGILALDHIINVISPYEPTIQKRTDIDLSDVWD